MTTITHYRVDVGFANRRAKSNEIEWIPLAATATSDRVKAISAARKLDIARVVKVVTEVEWYTHEANVILGRSVT